MAEQILLTRIANKYDTLSNWNSSSIVLKAGEIAFAYVEQKSTDGSQYVPTVLMKVGDGSKTFSQLPWSAARAADVYDWAKLENPTVDQLPANLKTAITDLQTAVGDGGSVADAIKGAIDALDSTSTGSGTIVKSVVQTDGKVAVTMGTLSADEIPTLEIGKINGLQGALDAKLAIADFNTFKGTNTTAIEDAKQAGLDATSALNAYKESNSGVIEDIVDGTTPVAKATDADKLGGTVASDYALKTYADQAEADAIAAAALDATSKANAAEKNAKDHADAEIAKVQKELDDYQTSNDAAVKAAKDLADANKATLDAFFDENAVSDAVVNTLKEIQEQLNSGDTGAAAILGEVNKIKDGTTVVPKATHAVNADKAADADKLGGTAAADYALKSDLTSGDVVVNKAETAAKAESLTETAKAEVKAVKVDNAAAADTATKATQDANGNDIAATYETIAHSNENLATAKTYAEGQATAAKEAVIGAEGNASTANTVYGAKKYADEKAAAAQSAAEGHADGLNSAMDTRVKAIEDKPAMGITADDIADWKEASTIADTAVQEVVGSEGLSATKSGTTVTIGFDETTVFVFDCGNASGNSKL